MRSPYAAGDREVTNGRPYGRTAIAVLFCLALARLPTPTRADTPCASLPLPIRDLDAIDYHAGPHGLLIDPTLRTKNDAAMEAARTFVRLVSASADHFVADGKAAAGLCTLAGLRIWAEGGALLGTMSNSQAERERTGLLSGLAFAYLKTRELTTAADRLAIEPWLDKVARGVEASFADPARPANRRLALVALATVAVGAATDNHDHWSFGEGAYDQSLAGINGDGVIEFEMMGGERALFGQDFALGSLVMTAEIAARGKGKDWQKGEDWYERKGGAIHRLANRVLDGLRDPAWFSTQTGKEQAMPSGRDLAWIAFYARRFPDRFAGRVPDGAIFQSARLGGDLAVLAEKWVR
ncbi:MAG: alginate lyase family protein [Hyphomicrobiales bacterium]|nr:alginate lyase family protein [Hyphomicrobiales bacterium]